MESKISQFRSSRQSEEMNFKGVFSFFLPCLFVLLTEKSTALTVTTFQCLFQKDFMTFHHDFKFIEFYECNVKSPISIEDRNATVTLIQRLHTSHMVNKTNDDVTELFINHKNLKFIPQNFGKIFKNLEYLAIWNSELAEIEQKDLQQFPNLKYLCLKFNKIEVLGENVFAVVPKLEFLRLFMNKIKEIHSTAFNGLTELKTINLKRNECVDKEFVNSKQNVHDFVTNLAHLCQFSNEIANFTEIIEDVN